MAISKGRLFFFYPGGSCRLTFGQTAAPVEKDLMEQRLSRGLSPIQTWDYPYRPYHNTKPPLPQHPNVHGEAWDLCPSVKNQNGEEPRWRRNIDVAFWACGARQGTAKASGQAVLFRHRQKARPTAPLSPSLSCSVTKGQGHPNAVSASNGAQDNAAFLPLWRFSSPQDQGPSCSAPNPRNFGTTPSCDAAVQLIH